MKRMNRRFFLKTSAGVGGALIDGPVLCDGWLTIAHAEQTGYFEKEFGVTDAMCGRVLAKALSKGGDFYVGIFGQFFDKGEIVRPVCEMNIADNHLKSWQKLVECANDPWPYSPWRMPSLVFTDIVVSGT